MARDPYDIRKIFNEMELALILSMQRTISRHTRWEEIEGFQWEQWQKAKLRELRAYRKRNAKIIDAAGIKADELIDEALLNSFVDGQKRYESLWNRFVNAILKPFGRKRMPVSGEIDLPRDVKEDIAKQILSGKVFDDLPDAGQETSFFGINEKKLEALQDSVKGDLKKAEHGALRKMDDVYKQVIYKAEVNMAAGAKTLKQAVDMATKDFLDKGINNVEYSDGRRINIASYAEMALRTANQRATFLGEGKKRDEWGIYTVVMSAHANCSSMCLPYQGTVMIDDVYANGTQAVDPKLVLLSEAMKNHAFHPNCRHTLATYFPGITQLPNPIDEAEAVKNYEAEQRQRYIERQIRRYKRLEAGTFDEDTRAKYSRKVNEWESRLKQHLDEHPHLRRDKSRETIEDGLTSPERRLLLDSQEEYQTYKDVLSDDIPDQATFSQLRNSEDWSLVQLDYRRRKRLIDNPELALPNAAKAGAADEKFTKYLFNPENKEGWAKGNAFTSRLGYNADNWQKLQQQITMKAKLYPATHKGNNAYGKLYDQRMVLYGLHGKPANTIIGWIQDQQTTKMTSAYIKEVKANGKN